MITSLTSQEKNLKKEEKIYNKIYNITIRQEKEKQRQIELEQEKEKQEQEQRKKYLDNLKKTEKIYELKRMRSNLITATKIIDCWHVMGYTTQTQGGVYQQQYGLSFIIKELERISSIIGFKGFTEKRMNDILEKIKTTEKQINNSDEYEKNLKNAYIFNGLLAQELSSKTLELCEYIRINNINTDFEYYKYSSWGNSMDCYQKTSEIIEIKNEYDKLMDAVTKYVQNVTGQNIKEEIKNTIQKQYLMVV